MSFSFSELSQMCNHAHSKSLIRKVMFSDDIYDCDYGILDNPGLVFWLSEIERKEDDGKALLILAYCLHSGFVKFTQMFVEYSQFAENAHHEIREMIESGCDAPTAQAMGLINNSKGKTTWSTETTG